MPQETEYSIKLYDAIGRQVATLVDEEKTAGLHKVTFDASRFASGMYFYRIKAGEFTETKKLLFVK